MLLNTALLPTGGASPARGRPQRWAGFGAVGYTTLVKHMPKRPQNTALSSLPTGQSSCRLCEQQGPLRDSHIIPRFAYLDLLESEPQGATARIVRVGNGSAIYDNRQVSEHLLCDACELRLCSWEGPIADIAPQKDNSFPALARLTSASGPGVRVVDGSALPADLGSFALSVFWRGSVSTKCPSISLGDRYNEQFRRFLMGSKALLPDARLWVHILEPSLLPEERIFDRVISLPEGGRCKGYHVYHFVIPGFCFALVVGRKPPLEVDRNCFLRTRRVSILPGGSLQQAMSEELRVGEPKSLLKKALTTSR